MDRRSRNANSALCKKRVERRRKLTPYVTHGLRLLTPHVNMDPNVKLLTLLNVSAAKPGKRLRSAHTTHYDKLTRKAHAASASASSQEAGPSTKRQKLRTPAPAPAPVPVDEKDDALVGVQSESDTDTDPDSDAVAVASKKQKQKQEQEQAFDAHFGPDGPHARLVAAAAAAGAGAEAASWTTSRDVLPELGATVLSRPEGVVEYSGDPQVTVLDAFHAHCSPSALQRTLARVLGTYTDLAHTHLSLEQHHQARQTLAMHALSHITKTRRRILRNNERLAKAAAAAASTAAPSTRDIRDQGFTRPKVLLLLPLRNSALTWLNYLSAFSACPQVDNKARFTTEFSLPPGATDKLAHPTAQDRFPPDHIATFHGNIDDNFRVGLKLTRKSLKLYSPFYDSDLILASPLGLRLAIEKDNGDADFLSSIELLVLDQADVMAMQNWEHVKFVLERINAIPKHARDTDFSRVKPHFLDGRAAMLRQSVLLSAYDFPALRAVYSALNNVAGKRRTLPQLPVHPALPARTRHTFARFDASTIATEPDARLAHFTSKTLPTILKSAVGHTLLFIPSYFDFVRIDDHLRKQRVSYSALSEYVLFIPFLLLCHLTVC